jgi:hypothetical protein
MHVRMQEGRQAGSQQQPGRQIGRQPGRQLINAASSSTHAVRQAGS